MHGWREDIATAARLDQSTAESLLHIFFAPTETSRAKGGELLGRFMEQSQGRDTPTTLAARDAQYDAIVEWGIPDHGALLIPDAQIRIYPDSAHAFLFQEPQEVAATSMRSSDDPGSAAAGNVELDRLGCPLVTQTRDDSSPMQPRGSIATTQLLGGQS